MAIMDRSISLEELDALESVSTGTSVIASTYTEEMGEIIPFDNLLAEMDTIENEYTKEVENLSNAYNSISMLVDKDIETSELIKDPSSITIKQVEDAREVLNKSIITCGLSNSFENIDKRDQIATESFNDPLERMQIAREDIVETIKKIGEFFINIFRKIIAWFKKATAKFVATFNSNHARCIKLRKELVSRSAGSAPMVDSDEIQALFASNPFIGATWSREGSVTKVIDYVHSENIVSAVNEIVKVAASIMTLAKDISVDRKESSQNDVDNAARAIIENLKSIENLITKIYRNGGKFLEDDVFKKIGATYIKTEDARDVDVIVPYRMDGKKLKAIRIAYDNAAVTQIIQKAKSVNSKRNPKAAVLDGLANEFVFEYKHFIELEDDEEDIKKKMPGKLLSYQSLKTIVNKMEKYAKKSPEHCKKVLANLTAGENLSKSMQQAYKAIAVNDGVSYGTAAMKRACNLGKVAAVDLGVDIIIGAVKTQTIILKQVEDHIKFYDKKKGR